MKLFYVKYAVNSEHITEGIFAHSFNHLYSILKSEHTEFQLLESRELTFNHGQKKYFYDNHIETLKNNVLKLIEDINMWENDTFIGLYTENP